MWTRSILRTAAVTARLAIVASIESTPAISDTVG